METSNPLYKCIWLIQTLIVPKKRRAIFSNVKEMLEKRAWLTHTILSLYRVLLFAAGSAAWQRGLSQASRESIEHNADLVDDFEIIVRYGLIILTFIGLILDMACIKWLRLAHTLFYLELAYSALMAMVPFENGHSTA